MDNVVIGGGFKREVEIGGNKVRVQVIGELSAQDLQNLLSGRPYNLAIEGQAKGALNFGGDLSRNEPGVNVDTTFKLKGSVALDGIKVINWKVDGSALFGSEVKTDLGMIPVGKKDIGSTYDQGYDKKVGVGFEANQNGATFRFERTSGGMSERRRHWEDKGGDIIPGVLAIDGKYDIKTNSSKREAVLGAVPGASNNNQGADNISVKLEGKLTVNAGPITVYIKGTALSLSMANDSRNGEWVLRQQVGYDSKGKPQFKDLGVLRVDPLLRAMEAATMGTLEQVIKRVPGLNGAQQIIDNSRAAEKSRYRQGDSIGVPGFGELKFGGFKPDGRAVVKSRTTEYIVPLDKSGNKDSIRNWSISAVKYKAIKAENLYLLPNQSTINQTLTQSVYKKGDRIGIPGAGELEYKGVGADGRIHVSSRTTRYIVPKGLDSKDEVRAWAIKSVNALKPSIDRNGLYQNKLSATQQLPYEVIATKKEVFSVSTNLEQGTTFYKGVGIAEPIALLSNVKTMETAAEFLNYGGLSGRGERNADLPNPQVAYQPQNEVEQAKSLSSPSMM